MQRRYRGKRQPLWLLDVDGVLNAVTGIPDRKIWSDWEYGRATAGQDWWPIWYSPSVIAAVNRVHEQGLAEIRWLSTWGEHANGSLRELLGLPQFMVAGREPRWARSEGHTWESISHAEYAGAGAVDPLTGRWWKFDVVRDLHTTDPDRPIIWTDDDLRRHRGVSTWMRLHTKSLLLSPRPAQGLTPRMIRSINTYLGVSEQSTV